MPRSSFLKLGFSKAGTELWGKWYDHGTDINTGIFGLADGRAVSAQSVACVRVQQNAADADGYGESYGHLASLEIRRHAAENKLTWKNECYDNTEPLAFMPVSQRIP